MSQRSRLAEDRAVAEAISPRAQSTRFALLYASYSVALFMAYFVFAYPYSGAPYRLFTMVLHAYARASGAVLHLFDPSVTVTQGEISGRGAISIVRGCDGTEVLILFTAAVLASSSYPWRLRAVGVGTGVAVIAASNVARICSLYFLVVRYPGSMETWHTEVLPLFLVALAVGLFVMWSRWANRRCLARAP